jgi:hypothetical protein
MRRAARTDFSNDCDSEGNSPPKAGEFINPLTVDDAGHAPPRNNEPIQLPFFQVKERRRLREHYESRISFEDWVEDAEEAGTRTRAGGGVIKLEDDHDLPVGRPYFWKAYCKECSRSYHPHIPGQWSCLKCKGKVWQPPDDTDAQRCRCCKREVAAMITVAGKRLRNPMTLNAHMCKRCGFVVCSYCYSPQTFNLAELGYTEAQHVCTRCVKDLAAARRPPDEEDLGTLYEEHVVGDVAERNLCHRHWVPKCNRCNITFGEPPRRWACTSCSLPVWQPPEAADSATCWLCGAQHPKIRCHDCGQMVCHSCGAYAQPLPRRGFINMNALSVCKGCYKGSSVTKSNDDTAPFKPSAFKPACSQCKAPCGSVPDLWLSKCHKAKAWQVDGKACPVCAYPVTSSSGENCRRCGRLCCQLCTQYKEPVPDRGYDKTKAETICKECFKPEAVLEADPSDFPFWPPMCTKCELRFPKPPDRWRCPNQCGNVWQPPEHMASRGCWCCGKKMAGTVVNCRRCGRLVCPQCGEGRSQVPELGFTRGVEYPTCKKCLAPPPVGQDDSPSPTATVTTSSATATGATPATAATPAAGATPAAATPSAARPGSAVPSNAAPRGATPATAGATPAQSARATPATGRAVTPGAP